MSGNQMNVQWNNHLQSLGTAFPRMFSGQRFVDVTLACEGRRIHCHRMVLAVCSSYFEVLLEENPAQHPIIILPKDVKFWALQALVEFMYRGEVNVCENGLQDLLKCAEILQIQSLHSAYANVGGTAGRNDGCSIQSPLQGLQGEESFMPSFEDDIKVELPLRVEHEQPRFSAVRGIPKNPRSMSSMDSMPKIVQKRKVKNEESSRPLIRPPVSPMKTPKSVRSYQSPSAAEVGCSTSRNDSETGQDMSPMMPPEDFVLPNYSRRSFSRKDMWRAMMCVKSGKSIKEAAKLFKIPTPSLHHYTKRFGIKSPYSSNPMKHQHKLIQKKRFHLKKDNPKQNQA
ncbi:hypothetical protein DMENIID0001_135870 [Sergentomyia squamirostris]